MKEFWSKEELKWLNKYSDLIEKSGCCLTQELYEATEQDFDMDVRKLLFSFAYLQEGFDGFGLVFTKLSPNLDYKISLVTTDDYTELPSSEILSWDEKFEINSKLDIERILIKQLTGLILPEFGHLTSFPDLVKKTILGCWEEKRISYE